LMRRALANAASGGESGASFMSPTTRQQRRRRTFPHDRDDRLGLPPATRVVGRLGTDPALEVVDEYRQNGQARLRVRIST
jgi:hypothetical protein